MYFHQTLKHSALINYLIVNWYVINQSLSTAELRPDGLSHKMSLITGWQSKQMPHSLNTWPLRCDRTSVVLPSGSFIQLTDIKEGRLRSDASSLQESKWNSSSGQIWRTPLKGLLRYRIHVWIIASFVISLVTLAFGHVNITISSWAQVNENWRNSQKELKIEGL